MKLKLCLFIMLLAGTARADIKMVQSKLKQATFTANQTIAFNSTTHAGSTLIVFAGNFSVVQTVTKASDTVNGVWIHHLSTDAANGTTGGICAIWYCLNSKPLTSAQNVTITSGAGDQFIVLAEIWNAGSSSFTALDPYSYNATAGIASATGASSLVNTLTTTDGISNFLFAGVAEGNAQEGSWPAPNAGWTSLQTSGDATTLAGDTNWMISQVPGVYSYTWTPTNAFDGGSKMIALRYNRRRVKIGNRGL